MRKQCVLALAVILAVGAFAEVAGASKRSDQISKRSDQISKRSDRISKRSDQISKRSDRATARSLVVRSTDLAGDWTTGLPDADDADASDAATAKCLGVNKNPNKRRDAHAEGPGLTRSDGVDVQSSGNVFESRAALRASLALFDRPRLATCFERLLRASLREDLPNATIDEFTLAQLPVTIPGVQARGFRITVLVTDTDAGESATIVSDEILAWRGRLGSSATVTTQDAAPPEDLESEVAAVLGQRLLAAS